MGFGKILDQWDKHSGPFYDKDAAMSAQSAESPALRRRRLLRKSPDAVIDLHGLTRDEAWDALLAFFDEAKKQGLEKVLLIHGKGNHSEDERKTGLLKKLVQDFIERCPHAGENGHNSASSGGTGATWVLLKNIQRSL